MKRFGSLLALAGLILVVKSSAISLDDIQLWTGSGTNRAALVIEWSIPQIQASPTVITTVPAPIADKTLVWGYRFNGSASALDMLRAIESSDRRLYSVESYGGEVISAIGYNLKADGVIGITDGSATNYFTNGILTSPTLDLDAAHAISPGDLYWGGFNGPNWEVWNERNDAGGLLASPARGTNQYWTPDDTNAPYSGVHGQWSYAQEGFSDLPLFNGSWVGFSVAAAGDVYTNNDDPSTIAFSFHKHAPPSPDGTYVAYVPDTNDFAVRVVNTNGIYGVSPYNDPSAVLDGPTLKFVDHFTPKQTSIIHRGKIIEPPYWTDPASNNVITEINTNGQITVNMGRKIFDDPSNPYGVDFIVYGNSFMSASGYSGSEVTDFTDLDTARLGTGIFGHPTTISVSQDGTNWYTYDQVSTLFADNAYRWDEVNHAWTDEEFNPTKPIDPSISATTLGGVSVAQALERFIGGSGGTGYDLKESGLPWIQYVRLAAGTNAGQYTVIDAVAAVNPVVVGDALSIAPTNLESGINDLVFQKPDDLSETLVSVHVDSVSDIAKISTVSLNEFSSFAPVVGTVSSAYQLTLRPVTNTTVSCVADVGLRAGDDYTGNGGDLRVYQWGGTNWTSQPFNYNATNNEVRLTSVTNFSAFVVSQIVSPQLSAQAQIPSGTNGFAFQFTPVANVTTLLERSLDLLTWIQVASITPTNSQPVTLQDFAPPADKAFYRLHLIIP